MTTTTPAVPDAPLLGSLGDVRFDPVFIMGDHRSGTTILYQLLNASGCFNIVTAYNVLGFDALLHHHRQGTEDEARRELARTFRDHGIADRVIDRVAVTPETPEEYGFVFDTDGFRLPLTPGNRERLVELCRKIQTISDPERPILLKNPWDYFLNFVHVKESFPDSKFVFIHRHPVGTINSQLNATRRSFARRNAYQALLSDWYRRLHDNPLRLRLVRLAFRGRLGLWQTTRHVERAFRYYVDNIARIPERDFVTVRYEQLCEDPGATVRGILDALGIPERQDTAYDALVNPRKDQLCDDVAGRRERIVSRMHPYLRQLGYAADRAAHPGA